MNDLFDLESGWKNSEIARAFVKAAEAAGGDEPIEALVPTDVEKASDGSIEVALEPVEVEPKIEIEQVRAEFDMWRAREALVRLAGQAVKSGQLKAAYMIERAITELDSE